MTNSIYQNIAIGLLILTALVLLINKKYKVGSYIALGIFVILALFFPFAGFLGAIPIFLIVWLENSPTVWETWDKLKNQSIKEDPA